MPQNMAAWLPAKFERLKVREAPYTAPGENEIVLRNHAVAINPVDWIKQQTGDLMFRWVEYPAVLGSDLAGEVIEVGAKVTRFRPGDRALALAVGLDPPKSRAPEGAFQLYTIVRADMAAPIPPSLSYEAAAVLPLGLSTAASGLFQKDYLALRHPTLRPVDSGETLLIWGGSTSVGSNAVQLAVAAGYRVITTASPRNFEYVRRLGASEVFDYNSRTVRRDIKRVLKDATFAGALAIGPNSAEACIDIAGAAKGKRFVALASAASLDPKALPERPARATLLIRFGPALLMSALRQRFSAWVGGVKTKFIWGSSLKDNEVSGVIFGDFLPKALAAGAYAAAPTAVVVGTGLEAISSAFDRQKRGVSAQKIVVTL